MVGNIELYDAKSIDELKQSSLDMTPSEIEFLIALLKGQPEKYIENAKATLLLLRIDNQLIPLTICDYAENNTYLLSPYAQYIKYAIEELSVLNGKIIRMMAHTILLALGSLVKAGKIDKCIHVNNWLFPTNIYPRLSQKQIKQITEYLTNKYCDHAILFRTMNFITDDEVIKNLKDNNYHLIGSRQVHILSKEKLKTFSTKKPRDFRKDEKILNESGYVVEQESLSETTVKKLKELYGYLYLEKHSLLNPQYTQDFISLVATNKVFTIKLVKNVEQIDAFIGYMTRHGVTYAPFFGYDTKLPSTAGLYRILSTLKINAAIENNTLLHSSAGAAGFKRHRGHESTLEYHAVYIHHLSSLRKIVWKALMRVVNKIGMPMIQKFDT